MNPATEDERRAAVVLHVLGSEFSEAVLAALPVNYTGRLQSTLEAFRLAPPTEEEIDDVFDELERFLRFAGEGQPSLQLVGAGGSSSSQSSDSEFDEDDEPDEKPREPRLSNNPKKQLTRLKPFQIAGALQHESPRAIAIVLGCVSAATAGEVLEYLPEDLQNQVIVDLCETPTAPEALVVELVRTTVEKGIRLDQSAVADASAEAVNRVAEILRSMKKVARNQLVNFLDNNRAETAGEIKKKLYVFDDLISITDRSLQRMLSRVESTTLATALNGANDDIREKVLSNLSKRARAALEEEMELASDLTDEERAEGCRAICQVMAEMDQDGELAME